MISSPPEGAFAARQKFEICLSLKFYSQALSVYLLDESLVERKSFSLRLGPTHTTIRSVF